MRRTPRSVVALAAASLLLVGPFGLAGCGKKGNEVTIDVRPSMTAVPTGSNHVPESFDGVPDVVGTATTGLTTPWGMDFLPNGVAVVTERTTGRVLLVNPSDDPGGPGTVTDLGKVKGLSFKGDGGLLGVAVSPTFVSDNSLYFYETTKKDNRIVRMPLTDAGLGQGSDVLTGIPAGATDNGGALRFGPDGFLYVGTGDAGRKQLARNKKSLAGKILRLTPDGAPAQGNPANGPVLASGFRDVLGLAFDGDRQLWATDSGTEQDELNHILPGTDGGWPTYQGRAGGAKFQHASITWAPNRATPGGIAFVGGYLWITGVRGHNLWRVKVDSGQVGDSTPYFSEGGGRYGSLRAAALSPDGALWLATNNTDGAKPKKSKRAAPGGDDRILTIQP